MAAVAFRSLMQRLLLDLPTAEELDRCGISDLAAIENTSKETLMKTLDNVNRYTHPARPEGAVCYVTANCYRQGQICSRQILA